jgi:hypothetical protein
MREFFAHQIFGPPWPPLGLSFSVFKRLIFILKYIKIIFFIFKKLFLILIYQNNLKIIKNIYINLK